MGFNYNKIFNIPERSLVQQRLTKAFFLRNSELSVIEKKTLNTSIQQMEIIGQIIPEKSNIPPVVNETDSYQQILLVVCTVSDNQLEKVSDSCIQLIQKYISFQVVLVIQDNSGYKINTAQKRINQKDTSKLTIERYFTTETLSKLYKNNINQELFKVLDFVNLDKTNLELLYKGYIQALVQYNAAAVTGVYQKRSYARTAQDMESLESIAQLELEVVTLVNQISKESQFNEKMQLNIKVKQKREEIGIIKKLLNEH